MGEPADGVADDLDVRDPPGDLLAQPGDLPELSPGRLLTFEGDRPQRGGRGQRRRCVLEAGDPPVDPVVVGEGVAPARSLAHQQHPQAGGPAPLVGRGGQGRPAVRQGLAADRGAGVHEQGYVAQRAGDGGHGLERPDLVVGGLDRDDGHGPGRQRAADVVGGDPTQHVDGHREVIPACPAGRVQHRGVLDGRVQDRRPDRLRAARSPSRPRCTASVPLEVKVTSSGRTPKHSATTSRALSSSSRAVRAGPCSRRGSAYPWSSAASRTSRASGCSGSDEALSR